MIEIVIMEHLKTKISVPVLMEKPEPLLSEYVLFEKTSGGKANQLLSFSSAAPEIRFSIRSREWAIWS